MKDTANLVGRPRYEGPVRCGPDNEVFDCVEDAMAKFGVTREHIFKYINKGWEHKIGMHGKSPGSRAHLPDTSKRVCFDQICFPSQIALARFLGWTKDKTRRHLFQPSRFKELEQEVMRHVGWS